MTRKKHDEATPIFEHTDLLDELFSSNDDRAGFDFGGVELSPFGRILTAVTNMGGMVTVYRRSADGAIVVSVRIGAKRDQWSFDNEDQFDAILPTIADRFYSAYGKYLAREKAKRQATGTPATE